MLTIQPVSPSLYAEKLWLRHKDYSFSANDAVVPLTVHELSRAIMSLPVGFVSQGEEFVLVAVMGVQQGSNLCVMPDGRWLLNYIPAAYRAYPFTIANTEDGNQVLCFDESSGLLTENQGEKFYDEAGQLSKAVQEIVTFLTEVAKSRQLTARICLILQKHDLIQPWRIKVQDDQGEQVINGLFRIDEEAFNALSAEAFQELREAGAILVVYCQLLSTQNIARLDELSKAHIEVAKTNESNLDFLHDEGSLSFDNFDCPVKI